MDISKEKKYRIVGRRYTPLLQRTMPKKYPLGPIKKRDGALFPAWVPHLEQINFQGLLTSQFIPNPSTIKSSKIKKKIQVPIKAINKALATCTDGGYSIEQFLKASPPEGCPPVINLS